MGFFSDFFSRLSRALSPYPNMPPPREPPFLPEPLKWPPADASRLREGEIPPAGEGFQMAPDIVEEIRAGVQKDESRDAFPRLQFQRGDPPDPIFSGFRSMSNPRAFTNRLRRGIQEVYGGNPVPFYRAAGISRSAYSRLISYPERHPSKDTALAMAAALKLDEKEAEAFLELAGFALSPSYLDDVVWRICFRRGIHDLATIRAYLAGVKD